MWLLLKLCMSVGLLRKSLIINEGNNLAYAITIKKFNKKYDNHVSIIVLHQPSGL